MSSRYFLNEAARDSSKLRTPQDLHQQLLHSLTILTKSYPPQSAYSSHGCHGLYAGPTSIAYLFLHLSLTHSDLQVAGYDPLHWAEAYLSGTRSSHGVTADKNGVINEHLAFHAVRAALSQNIEDVKTLAKSVRNGVLTSGRGSDEWLYGRAGCLYLLRLARSWVPESARIVDPVIQEVIEKVLSYGPSWPWHGKDYLGKSPSQFSCLPISICTIFEHIL